MDKNKNEDKEEMKKMDKFKENRKQDQNKSILIEEIQMKMGKSFKQDKEEIIKKIVEIIKVYSKETIKIKVKRCKLEEALEVDKQERMQK